MKTKSASGLLKLIFLNAVLFIGMETACAQQDELYKIEWENPKIINYDNVQYKLPAIKGQSLDGNIPNFYIQQPYKSKNNTSVTLDVLTKEPATQDDIAYLKSQYIEVGDLKYELAISNANTKRYLMLNLFPYVKNGESIERITGFKLSYKQGSPLAVNAQKSFAANSVLKDGSGFWYKISVSEDGIYKIDKEFLEACGVDVASINPQDINIFGNGDGRLPELNATPRTDDLAKNAIVVVGESDGVFDDDDYILFYGWGPHRWYSDGVDKFNQDRNPYSERSCYFININPTETPLRMATLPAAPGAPTNTVTSYSYFDVHEQDLVSLVNGGQRWYGELFDTQLQRTITFNTPNMDNTSPVEIISSLASSSIGSLGTSQRYTVGGVVLLDTLLPTGTDYGRSTYKMTLNNPQNSIAINISITRNSPDALTYLDRLQINGRRNLVFMNSEFNFRDFNSVGVGNIAAFQIDQFPVDGYVWDVTDRHEPHIVTGTLAGSTYTFQVATDTLREFATHDGINYRTPQRMGQVEYQNLHGLDQVDYLIVTYKGFISQAERLANLHRANGMTVHVVTTEQVFNEFSSGALDAGAIRRFAKMFYDRGALDPTTRPKYLLLFGDGTYDPKGRVPNNNNYVLTYQVANSENHIASLVTDDFFGLLDDSESILGTDLLDIGVGRLLISDNDMAKEQVDKIQHYMHNGSNLFVNSNESCTTGTGTSTFGDWKTKYVQIADDEEGGYFVANDVEPQFDTVTANYPSMNCDKIYLDAYQQVSTAGGERYPDVNNAIDDRISRGALVLNYVGHGGEVGVAEERVITVPQIQSWNNINNMPLMVSATCEFTKYDDPDRVSAGEWASINSTGGAIALMTTTRSVYFGVNSATGISFYQHVFERDANHKPKTFGEIIMSTKNAVLGGGNNKRSFTLIGDPALRIAMPLMNVVTDSINGFAPSMVQDTLRALSKVTVKGHLEDFDGNPLTTFNGVVYPSVYDKPKEQKTLQNDPGSLELTFYTQTNKVYRGKASVVNGNFEFTFIVPKDINYSYDFGKISYYAENGSIDALGDEQRVYIGGVNPNGIDDNEGPQIELYMNDESFVNGGITSEDPTLFAKVFDENGINAVGNGIGHDLMAVLDGETSNPIILNEYYTADLDSYQSGEVHYDLSDLEPGEHTLLLKVWDVNNNSSETTIDFIVKEKEQMSLDHVLNYPNPFTTSTEFFFEHNQVCSSLEAQVQIFTISGKLVKTINRTVHTEGFRSEGIHWNGADDFGDQLAKGVYVYRLKVRTPEGSMDEKLEKLVILK